MALVCREKILVKDIGNGCNSYDYKINLPENAKAGKIRQKIAKTILIVILVINEKTIIA